MRKSSRTLDDLVKVIKTMVSEHQSSHTFHYSVPLQVYTKDISSHIISEGIAKNFHHDSIICIIKIWVPRAFLILSYPEQQSLSQIYPRCVTGGKIGTTDVGGVCFTHVLGTNNWIPHYWWNVGSDTHCLTVQVLKCAVILWNWYMWASLTMSQRFLR